MEKSYLVDEKLGESEIDLFWVVSEGEELYLIDYYEDKFFCYYKVVWLL